MLLEAVPASDQAPAPSSSGATWTRGRCVAWTTLLIVVGLALRWHALDVPFFSDDYMQLGMLAGLYPGEHAAWDLYTFIRADPDELALHRAAGTLPWWTWEEINGSVLRPLTSLTLWLDWKLWPANAPASHLHNLVWWAAMIVAASRLLFRALSPRVAALALAIIALDHGVSMNVAWVANRAALVCATFSFLALDAHLAARRAGRSGVSIPTLLLLSAALLGGEYGLVAFAYLFAYASVCERGRLRERWLPLWPAALPLAAYLTWHVAGNYGTFGEAVYAHPLRAPLAYLEWLGSRLPRALGDLLWSFPAAPQDLLSRPHFRWLGVPSLDALRWIPEGEWSETLPGFLRVHSSVAAVLVAGLLVAMRRAPAPRELDENQALTIRALGLGALLGLLPILVAPADARTLTVCQLGAAAWLARFLVGSYEGIVGESRSASDLLRLPLAIWLAGVHLIADPAYSVRHLHELRKMHQPVVDSLVALGRSEGDSLSGRDVVVLSTQSHTAAVHGGIVLALHGLPTPRRWHVLSMSTSALTINAVDERTLIVLPTGAPLLVSPVENFFHPQTARIEAGARFSSGPFEVEVLKKDETSAGEHPVAIKSLRLHFAEAIAPGTPLFLATDAKSGRLHRVDMPAPPGFLRVERPLPELEVED